MQHYFRYTAIVYPFKSVKKNAHVTEQRKKLFKCSKVHNVAVVIVIFAFVFCIVHFLEYKFVAKDFKFCMVATELRNSEIYSVGTTLMTRYVFLFQLKYYVFYPGYTLVLDLIVRIIIPSSVMAYTNFKVCLVIGGNKRIKHTEG